MWPSLFEDPKAMESYEWLRRGDERVAYMVAATDAAYRRRVNTWYDRLEAYAESMGELAEINATVEGYSPEDAAERRRAAVERAKRERLHDPEHPLAVWIFPKFGERK